MPIMGIDLGTSNSAAAVLGPRRLVIIPSDEGIPRGKESPSYVALAAGGQIIVSEVAAGGRRGVECEGERPIGAQARSPTSQEEPGH